MSDVPASVSESWHDRLFYIFFIGKRGPDNELILPRRFNKVVRDLRQGLKSALGGLTTVRSLEGRGETHEWGPEPTRLIIVIASVDQEPFVDETVGNLGKKAAKDLSQDAIWIAKQHLTLFVAQGR